MINLRSRSWENDGENIKHPTDIALHLNIIVLVADVFLKKNIKPAKSSLPQVNYLQFKNQAYAKDIFFVIKKFRKPFRKTRTEQKVHLLKEQDMQEDRGRGYVCLC